MKLPADDPQAESLVGAIRSGEVEAVRRRLAAEPALVSARIVDQKGAGRTLLHIVADWPGYYPHGPAMAAALIDAGCDPSAPMQGVRHQETPLHWAASSDDVEVARVLIDGGSDVNAPGACLVGGGPLDDAVIFGCWRVARLLVERGARVHMLFHAAGLGLLSRVEEFFAADPPPSPEQINAAFWHACNGGERRTAEYLLARGADPNAVPSWGGKRPWEAANSLDTGRQALIGWLREIGAK